MEFLLFCAGLIAGVINSLAGGGSFIAFPTLALTGLPLLSANATNTFAACPGYISGMYALREELWRYKTYLPLIVLLSIVGGLSGFAVLMLFSNKAFAFLVPWLMLLGTLLFAWSKSINQWLTKKMSNQKHQLQSFWGKSGTFLVAFYGGFFNAGQGILIIALYAALGLRNIHEINALKLLISAIAALVAIIGFIVQGLIGWYYGGFVLIGTLIGGYLAAHYGRLIPTIYLRALVIVMASFSTIYFFIKAYWII